jgi:hypothetical protein
MDFGDLGLNAIPPFIIPAFAGMMKGGTICGRFELQDREKKVLLNVLLQIEPFNDF